MISIRSPAFTERLGFARCPSTCTRPPVTASLASERVLLSRATHSQVSRRWESMGALLRPRRPYPSALIAATSSPRTRSASSLATWQVPAASWPPPP